jgi:hypothetical protein
MTTHADIFRCNIKAITKKDRYREISTAIKALGEALGGKPSYKPKLAAIPVDVE